MKVFDIQKTSAENDYAGCGKAWAAIQGEEIIAIRYMNKFAFNPSQAPQWVQAVFDAYSTINDANYTIESISPNHLSKIKKAAIESGFNQYGPRGGDIKASSIAQEAREILQHLERAQFEEYRDLNKKELGKLGEVISGTCSALQFVVL